MHQHTHTNIVDISSNIHSLPYPDGLVTRQPRALCFNSQQHTFVYFTCRDTECYTGMHTHSAWSILCTDTPHHTLANSTYICVVPSERCKTAHRACTWHKRTCSRNPLYTLSRVCHYTVHKSCDACRCEIMSVWCSFFFRATRTAHAAPPSSHVALCKLIRSR